MKVYICVGSSCHLKGSRAVIEKFKELVDKNGVADKVELNASFCLGKCVDGVSIKIDDELVTGLNEQNAEQIFNERILAAIK